MIQQYILWYLAKGTEIFCPHKTYTQMFMAACRYLYQWLASIKGKGKMNS